MATRPKHYKTVFDNGLTLIFERHTEFRSFSLGAWVKTGSRNERNHEAGASHFLEHMLFKGTKNRSALDIALEIDRVGGDFNAFTSREYTCFHLLLLDRDAKLGFEILSDILLSSDFNVEEMERERKVILQEIAMVEESPEELVHDLFFELIYKKHGLGKPILGTHNSIRKMRRGDLLRYFRKHYYPKNVVLSVVGDLSLNRVRRYLKPLLCKKWSGRMSPKSSSHGGAQNDSHPKQLRGQWWIERPTEQVHVVWGVEIPPYASKDRIPLLLLNTYLGGGMSSLLFQEIREKHGLAYTVYSNLNSFRDSGVFSVYAATSMNQVPLCIKLIEECLEKLAKNLLTDDELEITKNNLKSTILLASDSVESRMFHIAKNEIYFKRYFSVQDLCHLVDLATAKDIRRVARKLQKGNGNTYVEQKSVIALGPEPSKLLMNRFQMISK